MQIYQPRKQVACPRLAPVEITSAWSGIEQLIPDIIERFGLNTGSVLELGVSSGFSASAWANYFDKVAGVDTFQYLLDFSHRNTMQPMEETQMYLKEFPNVTLIKSDWREYIKTHIEKVDLLHVDMEHTEQEVYEAGMWGKDFATVMCFHDTMSFPVVAKGLERLSKDIGWNFYNWPHCYGFGILSPQ